MKKYLTKILAVILPLGVMTAVFIYAYLVKPFSTDGDFCLFLRYTGLSCPSCGATRSAYCLITGDFKGAIYYHGLFAVGFVPLCLALTGMGVNYAVGKKVLPLPKYRWVYFYAVLGAYLTFFVARNLTSAIF